MGADEWLHRINQWISMGFGSDVASAGQPTRHIFVLVLTVKTVRLGRSKSLGHVESSASRQLIRALQTDRKVNSYASRVTYLYRDLPWEKSKIIILSKKTNKIRSLLPKSSKNLQKKIWDTTDSTNEHSISIQLQRRSLPVQRWRARWPWPSSCWSPAKWLPAWPCRMDAGEWMGKWMKNDWRAKDR